MANYNLTNQPISASFQQLLQKNDNDFLVDGTGSLIENIKVTGSVSASTFYGDGSNLTGISGSGTADTGSLLTTASVSDATITFTKGDASQFSIEVNNVSASIQAEDLVITVKNASGVTLPAGTAVKATGVQGENITIVSASADNPSLMPAIGVLNEQLTNNSTGECYIAGRLENIDTSNLVAGAAVYVDINGGLTATKPSGSSLIQNIGIAAKINATEGELVIQGSGRSNDLPNITEGYLWVGDGDGVPEAISTGSFVKQSQTGSFVTLTTNQEITGRKTFRNNPIKMFATNAIQFGGFDTTTINSTGGRNLSIKALDADGGNNIKLQTKTDKANDNIDIETYNFDVDANNIKLSGSVGIRDSVDIQGNVTSSISKQNIIVNPKTITDDVIIGENSNALVVGDVTFAGTVTIGSGSELSVFDEPQLGTLLETASISGQTLTFTKQDTSTFDIQIPAQSFDTGSFATTGSNTFNANQIVSGSLTATNGVEIGQISQYPGGTTQLGVYGSIVLRSGSGIITDGAFGTAVPFDSNVAFFNGIDLQGTDITQTQAINLNAQDPLPGAPGSGDGKLAASGSAGAVNLYWHNGTSWAKIN